MIAKLARTVADACEVQDDRLRRGASIPCVQGTSALASCMDVPPGRDRAGGEGVVVAIALESTATGGA